MSNSCSKKSTRYTSRLAYTTLWKKIRSKSSSICLTGEQELTRGISNSELWSTSRATRGIHSWWGTLFNKKQILLNVTSRVRRACTMRAALLRWTPSLKSSRFWPVSQQTLFTWRITQGGRHSTMQYSTRSKDKQKWLRCFFAQAPTSTLSTRIRRHRCTTLLRKAGHRSFHCLFRMGHCLVWKITSKRHQWTSQKLTKSKKWWLCMLLKLNSILPIWILLD